MTPQEAIKELKRMQLKTDDIKLNAAIYVAVSTLEKQMQKKPTYEGDGYDDKGNLIYDTCIVRIVIIHMRLIMTDMISVLTADRL